MTRLLVAMSCAVFAAGCSGGDGGGSSPGGFVRVEHRVTAGGAEATYARAEFSDVATTRPKRGRCAFPQADGEGSWRDVGDAITVGPIVLPRATLGSLVVYGADGLPASVSPAGAELDVALPGSDDVEARTWENAIAIPAPIVPGEIANQIGFSADQPFTWTAPDAEEVVIEIASGGHVDLVCLADADRGELVVPLEQNAELDPGGGSVTFRAVNRRHATLGGDAIRLEGQSVAIVPYQ